MASVDDDNGCLGPYSPTQARSCVVATNMEGKTYKKRSRFSSIHDAARMQIKKNYAGERTFA